ncbi:MAG: ChbG/HpnK family deacetylase, partial [Alphaproteobacteria bacterium]|nr:ChbG/HpnK family deacetylase [Alphaproteobacteria bacterium]
MRRLVVTADDFGLSVEVNEAVEAAHREGILTSASLMVAAPAAADAVRRAQRLPDLGVGLHLTLLADRPMSPPESLPDLVDERGWFHTRPIR